MHDSYRLAEEREELARELERIATEDALTGALTRRAFFDRVGRGTGQQGAASGPVGSLLALPALPPPRPRPTRLICRPVVKPSR
jgi:hypothetical protein